MQASGDVEEFERRLRASLFRFDCPDPHTLGEYQLDLLDAASRTRVAAHAATCDECRAELQGLRLFLAEQTSVPETVLGRARRIVASLFTPGPGLAYGGLRGTAQPNTRIFQADDITVSIGRGPTPGSLTGLLLSNEPLADHEVRLLPREGAHLVTRVDDLGNFSFERVDAGRYALEIDLPDGVLVIEELAVD
jgi:hypothetical protein